MRTEEERRWQAVREKVARLIVGGINPLENSRPYQPSYDKADAILALPEIRIETEDQDIELLPYSTERDRGVHKATISLLKQKNFVKVIPKK